MCPFEVLQPSLQHAALYDYDPEVQEHCCDLKLEVAMHTNNVFQVLKRGLEMEQHIINDAV